MEASSPKHDPFTKSPAPPLKPLIAVFLGWDPTLKPLGAHRRCLVRTEDPLWLEIPRGLGALSQELASKVNY